MATKVSGALGLLLVAAAAGGTQAATLHVCPPEATQTGQHETPIMEPDGRHRRLVINDTEAAPGCRSLRLPVPANEIIALRALSTATVPRIGTQLRLQAPEGKDRTLLGELILDESAAPAAPTPMPWRENLLAGMTVMPFGAEERARATIVDGRLSLQCEAGNKPAGVILRAPWYLPQAEFALQLSMQGNGRFELQAIDADGAAKEAALTLGHFSAAAAPAEFRVALPRKNFDRAQWHAFALVCPSQKASAQIDMLRLLPQVATAPPRSEWIWQSSKWSEEGDALLARAKERGIATLFVAVPIQEGRVSDPARLAAFVRNAARRGIEVWSVDGDPQMVLREEHAAATARVRAYLAYNAAVEPEARLRGLQFDIEPYLLPGYEQAARDWDRRYVELVRALREASGDLPLDFVVPFWWADKTEILHALATHASSLSVMDYRTDPQQIRRFAVPFLDWAERHGKKVRIALEAGALEKETRRRYVKASSGELWLLTLEQTPVLVLLSQPHTNPHGSAFNLVSSEMVDGSATSFYPHAARLLELLPQLENDFSAWSGFAGMALHELN